jgi:hypothetical protein
VDVILDRKVTWKISTEMMEPRPLEYYSLFKSERLSANIKLYLHKALIRSVVTYTYPAWELEADIYVLKLQRLKQSSLHHS